MVPVEPDMAAKRTAIECYPSQMARWSATTCSTERLDANVPEQYWRLDPPPPGWEGLTSADDLTRPAERSGPNRGRCRPVTTALVTGASSGIGAATARLLA